MRTITRTLSNPRTIIVSRGSLGFSAYQVAVQHGFTGTEAEWLLSLQAGGAIAAHEAAADPHPQYTTPAEAAAAAPVQSVAGRAGDVVLSYADISGTVPSAALPPLAVNDTFIAASQAAMLALTAERGDLAVRTDNGRTYVLSTDNPGTLADWKEIIAPGQVVSVAGKSGVVTLVPADVGLSNVPNVDATNRANHTGTQASSTISVSTDKRLIGRDGGTAVAQEIQIGGGLSLTGGVLTASGNAQLDIYNGALLANNATATPTWTKPAGARLIDVLLIGGGGSGGSGRCGASANNRTGGSGGAAGGVVRIQLDAAAVAATVALSYGGRRTGGAGVDTAVDGNAGNSGIGSSFGAITAPAGSGGLGGIVGAGTVSGGAAVSNANLVGGSVTATSAGGSAHVNTPAGGSDTNGLFPTGGGGGGGLTNSNVSNTGAVGGAFVNSPVTMAGASGNGSAVGYIGGGGGGGTAGPNAGGAGGAGGSGGGYGSGGGGGGASVTGSLSGAGGLGGPGLIVILTHF